MASVHARINDGLTAIVILLALYIAISPLLPNISFLFRDDSPNSVAPYAGALADFNGSSSDESPEDNRLVIPSIGLDEPIYESSYISVIADGGVWHRPNSVIPTGTGNTVLVGHRFYGNNVSTFYHLDKLVEGEVFAVYWEGEELLYRVASKRVVEATETSIEEATVQRQLTMYTCHPLWSSSQRLVVVALPLSADNLKEELS